MESYDALLGLAYPTHVRRQYNVRSIQILSPPAAEPVDLATAKQHLRVVTSDEDTLIQLYISAARAVVESVTGMALVQQQWRVSFDRFHEPLRLPVWPLQSVDALKYYDTTGTQQTMTLGTDALLDATSRPPRLFPPVSQDFPDTQAQPAAVTVDCTVGFPPGSGSPGDPAANIPQALKAAILLLVGDMYENREASGQGAMVVENPTVDRLLWPYRSMEL